MFFQNFGKKGILENKIKTFFKLKKENFSKNLEIILYIKQKIQKKLNFKILSKSDFNLQNTILSKKDFKMKQNNFELIFDLKNFSSLKNINFSKNLDSKILELYIILKNFMKNEEKNYLLKIESKNLDYNEYFIKILEGFKMKKNEFFGFLNFIKNRLTIHNFYFLKHIIRIKNLEKYYFQIQNIYFLVNYEMIGNSFFFKNNFKNFVFELISHFFFKKDFEIKKKIKNFSLWYIVEKEIKRKSEKLLESISNLNYNDFLSFRIMKDQSKFLKHDKIERFFSFISLFFEIKNKNKYKKKKILHLIFNIYPEIKNNKKIYSILKIILDFNMEKNNNKKYFTNEKISELLKINKILFSSFFKDFLSNNEKKIQRFFENFLKNPNLKVNNKNIIQKFKNIKTQIKSFREFQKKFENHHKDKINKFSIKIIHKIIINFKMERFSDVKIYTNYFKNLYPNLNKKSKNFIKSLIFSIFYKNPIFICNYFQIKINENGFLSNLFKIYFSLIKSKKIIYENFLIYNNKISQNLKFEVLFLNVLNGNNLFIDNFFDFNNNYKFIRKNFFRFLFFSNDQKIENFKFLKKIFEKEFLNNKEICKELEFFFKGFENKNKKSYNYEILDNLSLAKQKFDKLNKKFLSEKFKKFLQDKNFDFICNYFQIEKKEFEIIILIINKKFSFLELNRFIRKFNLDLEESKILLSFIYLLRNNFEMKKNDIKFHKEISYIFNNLNFDNKIILMMVSILKSNFILFEKIGKKSILKIFLKNKYIYIILKMKFYFLTKKDKNLKYSYDFSKFSKMKNVKLIFLKKILKKNHFLGNLMILDYLKKENNISSTFICKNIQKIFLLDIYFLIFKNIYKILNFDILEFFNFIFIVINLSFLKFLKKKLKDKNFEKMIEKKLELIFKLFFEKKIFDKFLNFKIEKKSKFNEYLIIDEKLSFKNVFENFLKNNNFQNFSEKEKSDVLLNLLYENFLKNIKKLNEKEKTKRFLTKLNFKFKNKINIELIKNEENLLMFFLLAEIMKLSNKLKNENFENLKNKSFDKILVLIKLFNNDYKENIEIEKIECKIFEMVNKKMNNIFEKTKNKHFSKNQLLKNLSNDISYYKYYIKKEKEIFKQKIKKNIKLKKSSFLNETKNTLSTNIVNLNESLKENIKDNDKIYNIFNISKNFNYQFLENKEINFIMENLKIINFDNLKKIEIFLDFYEKRILFLDDEFKKYNINKIFQVLIWIFKFEDNKNIFRTLIFQQFVKKYFISNSQNLSKILDYFLNGWKCPNFKMKRKFLKNFFDDEKLLKKYRNKNLFLDLILKNNQRSLKNYLNYNKIRDKNILMYYNIIKTKKWDEEKFINLGKNFIKIKNREILLKNIYIYKNKNLSLQEREEILKIILLRKFY